MHIVVYFLRGAYPSGEGKDRLAGQEGFLAVVDDAGLHQLHQGHGKQLGMDAEILMVTKQRSHGIRRSTHADLQRRPVGDALGHKPGRL
ncbi:hypothetical protein SDC9_146253 [bioreactor metagenome]|uniref:Uncharacterized protein n=1 Tax=bioreactor metagenome TaxID=1076179 RepID=A0A645EE71_9ZZZZ